MSNLTAAKTAMAARRPPKRLALTITITGKSAEELFAVGPIDIRDHFLQHGFGSSLDPGDVSSVKFTVPTTAAYTRRIKKSVHKDNF